ncbi:MAG: MarC family NAAT transporter [Campylobacteraceae bacterium]
MVELLQALSLGLVLFIPLTNPLTTVALFLALTPNMPLSYKNRQAKLTAIYVFFIMVISFYFGQFVMKTFGISIPGLRIAGGLIVAFIGFRMLFPTKKSKKDDTSDEEPDDIAFVPLAMPSTAGPGTIAMIISMASTINSSGVNYPMWIIYVSSILLPLIISLILWISLRSADGIMKVVGKNGIEAISRVMGFLLVCMGTQFVINGVKELIVNFPN